MASTRRYKQEIEHGRSMDPSAPRRAVEPPIVSIFDGCCASYPDVTFARLTDGQPTLFMHHTGQGCAGYLEPRSFGDWYFGKHGQRHA